MTRVAVDLVDVYPLRRMATGELEALLLQRGAGVRCPGTWEAVHGHLEPEERPLDAARRELREETGLEPEALYNLSRVEQFYSHQTDVMHLVPVFAALVPPAAAVQVGPEHAAHAWLPLGEARERCTWPRAVRALDDAERLLRLGHAGGAEDVLRAC